MTTFPRGGIIPPVVTPFTPTGEIDRDGVRRVVDLLVEAGCHGLFALGSTSQVAYLTDGQRAQLIADIVAAANGRVPVLVGAIELTSARVIDQARRLTDVGADAIVATGPFYAMNDLVETADHFRAIHAAIDLPLVAYDVPVRVPGKLTPELLMTLGSEGVIVAVKDSSGDDISFRRLVAMNRAAGSPLTLFTGHEILCDTALLMGADGIVPGYANVDPHGYVRLFDAARAGDWAAAVAEQERLNAGFDIVFQAPGRSGDAAGVGAFKAAMQRLGHIDHAGMPFPLVALDGDPLARVQAIVDQQYARA
ncbi:dihydrodipicolinate synthase family protein [Mariniluteicoccus flavus]